MQSIVVTPSTTSSRKRYERYEKDRCSMSDLKQARALVEAARRDLSALRGMLDADVFADEIFGFHIQQAAEEQLPYGNCSVFVGYE